MSDKLDGNDGTVEAWHFLDEDRRLRYGDRRLVEPGVTLTVDGPPELCERGLHASVKALDALEYAPGPVVSRVVVGGEIVYGDDKIAGTERTALWLADAKDALIEWAKWCADYATQKSNEGGCSRSERYARDSRWYAEDLFVSFGIYRVRHAAEYACESLATLDDVWNEESYMSTWEVFNEELERCLRALAPKAPEASQEAAEAPLKAS